MKKALAEQLQDVIDALLVAQAKARLATKSMREQRLYLGLGLNHPDEEIARLISNVQYAQLLAEKKAKGAPAREHDPAPTQEVDGRLVSVSDAGDALVAHPVQDASGLSGVLPKEAEGLVVVGDESVEDAAPEPLIIPPTTAQPPAVDAVRRAQQNPSEEAAGPAGPPPVDQPDSGGAS